jgi:hypothetical protein
MIVALAASLALGASPQSAPQEPASILPDVQVQGVRRMEEAATRFVERVSAPPPGVEGLAVWDRPLCLEIANLSEPASNALRDRIAQRAAAVGVGLDGEGCRTNVTSIATSDGGVTARSLLEANPDEFRPASTFTQRDGRALRRFAESKAPVRWWTVSLPINEFSRRPLIKPRGTGDRNAGLLTGQLYFGEDAVYIMSSVVVVIDAARTGEIPISALADYVAFTVLAQVDDSSDYSGQLTILNLFQQANAPVELTAWDLAYLTALYEAPLRWSGVSRHQREIARHMVTPTPPNSRVR